MTQNVVQKRSPKISADSFDLKLHPHLPAPMETFDAASIQALHKGEATAHQQQHALKYLIEIVCATYDMSYRAGGPEGDRATCFADGKRFVGNTIIKALRINPEALKPRGETNG